MIDNVDGFFITRAEQQKLVTLLREVPDVVEGLAVAITSGAYPTKISYEPRVTVGEREQPLPFDSAAQEASDALRNELWGWARHVCEYRALDYDGKGTTVGLARWLDRNMIALALTEGSGTALDSIQAAIRAARRATKGTRPTSYGGNLTDAENAELNAMAIERMRIELGPEYAGLTARRIKTLRQRKQITPLRTVTTPDGEIQVYRLGDVLAAHRQFPARQSRKMSA